jgi:hypothetical protein
MFKSLLKLDVKTLLLIALVIIIVLMRSCDGSGNKPGETISIDGKKYEILKHTIDTVLVPHDTIVYRKGKDIYHEVPVYQVVPIDVDTLAILKNYYAKNVYIDTLKLADSLGYIVVNDTISENSLLGRLWTAQVNKTTIKEQIIVKELPRNQVYIGVVGGFDKVNIVNFAGPSLLLKTKTDKIYSVGVGYVGSGAISIQGGIYWKIKLKK